MAGPPHTAPSRDGGETALPHGVGGGVQGGEENVTQGGFYVVRCIRVLLGCIMV
jgi:hypothetical protein